MKTNLYVIFDVKAKFYNKPFYLPNTATAIRTFTDLANDMNTDIGKHPEDFILFEIGTYDDATATIESTEPHVIARAHELVEQKPFPTESFKKATESVAQNIKEK